MEKLRREDRSVSNDDASIDKDGKVLLEKFARYGRMRTVIGSLAIVATFGASQNAQEIDKWRTFSSDQHYLTPPKVCAEYVDMDRDLSTPIRGVGFDGSLPVVTDMQEAKELNLKGTGFVFNPDVEDSRSAAEDLNYFGVNFLKTAEWVTNFHDHKVEQLELSEHNLQINIYSSAPEPSFTLNKQRFEEMFLAVLNQDLKIGDPHYQEMLNCLQAEAQKQKDKAKTLDVYILPELDYCFKDLRYEKIDSGIDRGECQAQGFTPPSLKFEVLGAEIMNKQIMALAFRSNQDIGKQQARINSLLAHEAVHFWLNQFNDSFELHPEERFVDAVEQSMIANNIADINNPANPPVIFNEK